MLGFLVKIIFNRYVQVTAFVLTYALVMDDLAVQYAGVMYIIAGLAAMMLHLSNGSLERSPDFLLRTFIYYGFMGLTAYYNSLTYFAVGLIVYRLVLLLAWWVMRLRGKFALTGSVFIQIIPGYPDVYLPKTMLKTADNEVARFHLIFAILCLNLVPFAHRLELNNWFVFLAMIVLPLVQMVLASRMIDRVTRAIYNDRILRFVENWCAEEFKHKRLSERATENEIIRKMTGNNVLLDFSQQLELALRLAKIVNNSLMRKYQAEDWKGIRVILETRLLNRWLNISLEASGKSRKARVEGVDNVFYFDDKTPGHAEIIDSLENPPEYKSAEEIERGYLQASPTLMAVSVLAASTGKSFTAGEVFTFVKEMSLLYGDEDPAKVEEEAKKLGLSFDGDNLAQMAGKTTAAAQAQPEVEAQPEAEAKAEEKAQAETKSETKAEQKSSEPAELAQDKPVAAEAQPAQATQAQPAPVIDQTTSQADSMTQRPSDLTYAPEKFKDRSISDQRVVLQRDDDDITYNLDVEPTAPATPASEPTPVEQVAPLPEDYVDDTAFLDAKVEKPEEVVVVDVKKDQ